MWVGVTDLAWKAGREGTLMTTQSMVDASLKMQCVQKPKRRGRAPKQVPDAVAEGLSGLLPDDALADAVPRSDRGLGTRRVAPPV